MAPPKPSYSNEYVGIQSITSLIMSWLTLSTSLAVPPLQVLLEDQHPFRLDSEACRVLD